MDILFLIGRILFGGYFIVSGLMHFMSMEGMTGFAASKRVPMPGPAVAVTGLMLLLGGLGILLGAYVEIAIWVLVVFLVVAAFKMHDFWKVTDEQEKMTTMIFFMRNWAIVGALLMMLMLELSWPYALNL